eukprot:SAG11_NODE_23957_length_380_cov_1.092527_1_plen_89_part_10
MKHAETHAKWMWQKEKFVSRCYIMREVRRPSASLAPATTARCGATPERLSDAHRSRTPNQIYELYAQGGGGVPPLLSQEQDPFFDPPEP